MRILALETTDLTGTVAALEGDKVLLQNELNPGQRSAQSLAPALARLWQAVGWKPTEIELIAVALGPGSFTGLRVGVTTAKMLAYLARAQVLGVDTLETIAAQAMGEGGEGGEVTGDRLQVIGERLQVTGDRLQVTGERLQVAGERLQGTGEGLISAAVDAQRGDVVARLFQRSAGRLWAVGDAKLLPAPQWLAELPPGTWVTGPVLGKLAPQAPPQVSLVAAAHWRPTAATVGLLAARDFAAGRRDDPWRLLPIYSRRAAAEEKWEAQQKGQQ